SGHITACKISDANPNELVASWSGDHIYSFDVNRASEPRDGPTYSSAAGGSASTSNKKAAGGRAQESRDRKRKRAKEGSAMSLEAAARGHSRQRTGSASTQPEDLSLRVNYGNGQREDIPIGPPAAQEGPSAAPSADLPDFLQQSDRIARGTIRIRKALFSPPVSSSLAGYAPPFSSALKDASSILEDADEVMRAWRYPLNPSQADVVFQRKLRHDRESTARFIQAAGTLARVLGGRMRTLGGANADAAKLEPFLQIRPALNEAPLEADSREQFGYDFLKAVCLWLDSGPGGLVRGFTKTPSDRSHRFPIVPDRGEDEAGIDAIDEQLIPYLLRLASATTPILNIEASPFEVDDNRVLFASEQAAVLAFAQAVKIPFEDLTSGAVVPATPSSADRAAAQDRRAALRFWGLKVGRGMLIGAAEGVDFRRVDTAFGGLGALPDSGVREEERRLARLGAVVAADGEAAGDEVFDFAGVSSGGRASMLDDLSTEEMVDLLHQGLDIDPVALDPSTGEFEEDGVDEAIVHMLTHREDEDEDEDDDEDDEDEDEDEDDDMDDEGEGPEILDSDSNDDDDDYDDEDTPNHVVFRSGRLRSLHRSRLNINVPVAPHTRVYTGHCNTKTVKDVNFYGLQDEYVVSGSDSGHLFIWDRASARLVNILEGDGEVVNVVQAHPYEPLLAVSGIDNTV
ncbi:MAG: hypothetical protein INR71_10030, partial [Terriglobus roseus]|nr:hypothetical protein [Terriglobus roseus]